VAATDEYVYTPDGVSRPIGSHTIDIAPIKRLLELSINDGTLITSGHESLWIRP
jgi:hypothetical protein